MSMGSVRDRVRHLLEPVVAGAGMDLEDVALTSAGKRRVLRVVVDTDGGVTLDDVAGLSQEVSTTLDSTDVMGGTPYVLEVTSPGVDRPLTLSRHWRRSTGRLVRLTRVDGRQLSGRVLAADDGGATLEVNGSQRYVAYGDVARARVQVEFNHPGDEDLDSGPDNDGESGEEA